ncbi:TPA_asm: protein 3a [Cardamom polerovirus]|uniref:Protein 3a n=1 Tax=Cardamom polerovirus TaxID=2754871 RepID=A0AAD2KQS2_9VIRU|nr:TPA_asm: protein 3a [Cardamom polerovirus]
MDFKFLAGFLIGILITVPVIVIGVWCFFLRASDHVRKIIYEVAKAGQTNELGPR